MDRIVDESHLDENEEVPQEMMDLEQADQLLEEERLRREALNSVAVDFSRASGAATSGPPPPAHAASSRSSLSASASVGHSASSSASAGHSAKVSVAAAATAAAALAGASGDGQGINIKLLELLIEQQKLISGVQVKKAEVSPPPPPGFQSLTHPQSSSSRPQPVRANSSLLLGAQMGRLALGPERSWDRVDVLTANAVATHRNNMDQLRKQQQRDAELKVVLVCHVSQLSSCAIESC